MTIASDRHETASIVETLLREGQVTGHGNFTLDMVKARDKLRHFQLLSPHLFVLELVGAAVSGHATAIDVVTELGRVSIVMHEVQPYSKTELAQLQANLFLSQDDPRLDRLRQLAIGLNSALALNPRGLEVQSGHPRGVACVRLTEASMKQWESSLSDGSIRTTVKMVDDPGPWGVLGLRRLLPQFDEELALVRGRCRHADLPIRINRQPINRPVRLEPCMAQVTCQRSGVRATLALASSLPVGLGPYLEEKERYGPVFWYTGHPFGAALDESQIIFMVNGVMLADKRVSLLTGVGVKVLCAAPGLLKNASQSDIVENARYQHVLNVLRNMVPELITELRRTVDHMESVLANPKAWPHEGSGNFRRYLAAELELGRSYLKRWGEAGWEAEEEAAEEVAVPVAPAPVASRSREWIAYTDIESEVGHGWMGLPTTALAAGLDLRWDGQSVTLPTPFLPTRLCGRVELALDPHLPWPPQQKVVLHRTLSDGVEQLLSDAASDMALFPAEVQDLARVDILEFLLAEKRRAQDLQKAPPFSVLGRLTQAPIFHATDGTSLSLQGLFQLYAQRQTLHYTSQPVSGRSLDPGLRVVRLSTEEAAMLQQDLFKLTEYSEDLQEEEKARQLQRERGMVAPRLDPGGMLAHLRWPVDGGEMCLALPRPYTGQSEVKYYKRGVLIEATPLADLPCIGFVHSNRLQVDDEWRHVTLLPPQRHALEQNLQGLYDSLAEAVPRIDPSHPDYLSCVRYLLDNWRRHAERLLTCGGPQQDPPVFGTRHGRRLGLSAIIRRYRERGRVEMIEAGDLQMVVPEGVIVLGPDQHWMRDFLVGFFGETHVHEWRPDRAAPPQPLRLPAVPGLLHETLQGLFAELGMAVRVERVQQHTPSMPRDTIGYWMGDHLYLNCNHRLVRDVERRSSKDRGRILQLLMALLLARDNDHDGEAVLQLRAIQAVLTGLAPAGRAEPC